MDAGVRLNTLTRLGFAARGLVYIMIAWLLIRAGRAEDPSGVLQRLAEGGGKLLMIVIAAGFIAYGVWRLADALFNIERHPSDGQGLRQRLGAGGSGIVYLLLAWQAVRLVQGDRTSGESNGGGRQLSLLGPDEVVLPVAGLVLVGVGIYQLIKAFKASFLHYLEPQIANRDWVKWTGRLGYAARGIVFLISGYFFLKAGLDGGPSSSAGTDAALAWLDNPWDVATAIGLFGFGLFSLVEARYRIIHAIPVEAIAHGDARPTLH